MRMGSTHQSTTALKTTHQEKTYAMYHTYDDEVTSNAGRLKASHKTFFALSLCFVLISTFCEFYFISRKNMVNTAIDNLELELAATRNITTTLELTKSLATWSFNTNTRPFVEGGKVTAVSSLVIHGILFNTATLLLSKLEFLRSSELSSAASSRCVAPGYTAQGGKRRCPLKSVVEQLKSVDEEVYERVLDMIVKDRAQIAEQIYAHLLKRMPASWTEVTGPMFFVFQTSPYYYKINSAVESYISKLKLEIDEVAKQRYWDAITWSAVVLTSLVVALIAAFTVSVAQFSRKCGRKADTPLSHSAAVP